MISFSGHARKDIASMTHNTIEMRRPPRNALAFEGGVRAWLSSRLRLFADLQVCSVSRHSKTWLNQRRGSVLEVGCGDQPYARFIPRECRYVAIDRQASGDDFKMSRRSDVVYYYDDVFPVASDQFESLFHTEVLEHVYETSAFLTECHRVLKAGGEMFFTVPFQARFHFKPCDYFRFTPTSLERILTDNGFDDIRVLPRGNDITVAAYKVAAVGFRWAYGSPVGKALFFLSSPLTILALLIAHFALAMKLGSKDDCLGYSVLACKKVHESC